MTVVRILTCNDCGGKYRKKFSGADRIPWDKGSSSTFCSKCVNKNPFYGPIRTEKWVKTDEVTPEQMFRWEESEPNSRRESTKRDVKVLRKSRKQESHAKVNLNEDIQPSQGLI